MQSEREIDKKANKISPLYQKAAGEESGALVCVEMAFLGLAVKLEALSVSFGDGQFIVHLGKENRRNNLLLF